LVENLRRKYFEKNALIDDCDEVFDQCGQLVKQVNVACEKDLEEIAEVQKNLEAVSPLNNPSSISSEPEKLAAKGAFIEKLQKLQQTGFDLRDKIEVIQTDCDDKNEKLREIVTPLSELDEREVSTLEVNGVKRDEDELLAALQKMLQDLIPLEKEIPVLDGNVKDLINNDKEDKLAQAIGKLTDLDIAIDELDKRRDEAVKKLGIYQDLIRAAKADQGRNDSNLMATLSKLDTEAAAIERDLKDIDTRYVELKKKRNEIKKYLDDVSGALHKFTSAQIDTTISALND
jgi:DNA repair exonuclease SbcCD ATPase subunit